MERLTTPRRVKTARPAMEIRHQLSCDELSQRLSKTRDFACYIAPWLAGHPYWYVAGIHLNTFSALLLNSSPASPSLRSLADYPLMSEVIQQIQEDPSFLTKQHPNRGLSSATVRKHLAAGCSSIPTLRQSLTTSVPPPWSLNHVLICAQPVRSISLTECTDWSPMASPPPSTTGSSRSRSS